MIARRTVVGGLALCGSGLGCAVHAQWPNSGAGAAPTTRVDVPVGGCGMNLAEARQFAQQWRISEDLDADPDLIAPAVEGVRIFAGYSGWTIGQLEGEIERDDWIVLSALPSDVLVEQRVDLWSRVLRRQPLPLSLLATHPIDVSRN